MTRKSSRLLSHLYSRVPLDQRAVPLVQTMHLWFSEEALVDETLEASHTHESSNDNGKRRDRLPSRHYREATLRPGAVTVSAR